MQYDYFKKKAKKKKKSMSDDYEQNKLFQEHGMSVHMNSFVTFHSFI